MHFKYDQNLELHNGIHAAIRGKLLEATFAPVWIEPLESAVLGYGEGGDGATTAQTFALSGGNYGPTGRGGRHKRMKFTLGAKGSLMLSLSNLYVRGCRLHDRIDAFIVDVGRIYSRISGCMDNDMIDPTTRQEVASMMPSFNSIRVAVEDFAKSQLKGKTEEEIAAAERIELLLKSFRSKVKFTRGKMSVDAWARAYLTCLCLEESNVKYQAGCVLLFTELVTICFACCYDAADDTPNMIMDAKWGNTVLIKEKGFVNRWKESVLFAPAVLAAATIGQNMIPTRVSKLAILETAYEVNSDAIANCLLKISTGMLVNRRDVKTICVAALCCTSMLVINSKHFGVTFNTTPRKSPATGNVDVEECLCEKLQTCSGFVETDTRIAITLMSTYVSTNPGMEVMHKNFGESIEMMRVKCNNIFQDNSCNTISNQTLGAYVGSMFSSIINYLGFHGHRVAGRDFQFWDPIRKTPTDMTDHVDRKNRVTMLACSRWMPFAGVLVASGMKQSECLGIDGVSVICLSLYLVFIRIMALMTEHVRSDGVTSDTTAKSVFKKLKAYKIDLEEICATAIDASRGYRDASRSFVNPAGHVAWMKNRYNAVGSAAVKDYVGRKLNATTQFLDNSFVLDTSSSKFGIAYGSPVFSSLYTSINNLGVSRENVFAILDELLSRADDQRDASTTHFSMHTATPMHFGDGDSFDFDGGDGSHNVVTDGKASYEPTMKSDSGIGHLQEGISSKQQISGDGLGDVLLTRSELMMGEMAAGSASPDVSESRGVISTDSDAQSSSQRMSPSNEDTATAAAAGTSKGRGGKTGGGSFKRVPARLL